MPSDEFRLQTSTLFLTYPRCDISKETLLEKLQEVLSIADYAISKELHQDGTPHLHAFIKLSSKLNTRDPRYLDVDGHHPNITRPRSIKAVVDYILKDGMTSYT